MFNKKKSIFWRSYAPLNFEFPGVPQRIFEFPKDGPKSVLRGTALRPKHQSLLFQEVSGTYHVGQDIIHFNKQGLSWTIGVQFLFNGLDIGPSYYHSHETTSVTPNILFTKNYASMYHFMFPDLFIDGINCRPMVSLELSERLRW